MLITDNKLNKADSDRQRTRTENCQHATSDHQYCCQLND